MYMDIKINLYTFRYCRYKRTIQNCHSGMFLSRNLKYDSNVNDQLKFKSLFWAKAQKI